MRTRSIGIDLGGTKIRGVVVDINGVDCHVIADHRCATPKDGGPIAIVSAIKDLVSRLESDSGFRPKRIGLGTPGSLSPQTGLLRNSNTVCLNGYPLKRELEAALAMEVVIQNDANCFAAAEAQLGAGRGAPVVFGVILGTGVGGGLVLQGQAWNGAQGIAGEWGHNVLEPGGAICYCGKRGCVETVISGPALERYYSELSGETRSLPEIAQRAESGEDSARSTISRLTQEFGRAISFIVNTIDPDVIVLGGGVSNINALYTEGVEAARAHIFSPTPSITIRKHERGDSAGVFGAALLAVH